MCGHGTLTRRIVFVVRESLNLFLLIVVSLLSSLSWLKATFFFVIVPQHMRFYDVNVHMFGKFISVCCGWYLYYEGRGDCMTMTVSHGMIINVFYNKSH